MENNTIKLSCGCLISLTGGNNLVPCSSNYDEKCKFYEEYLCNPKWVEWELQSYINSDYLTEDKEVMRERLQEIYDKRMKQHSVRMNYRKDNKEN